MAVYTPSAGGSASNRHREADFCRINSRLSNRFFRRRHEASQILQNTIVNPTEYGIILCSTDGSSATAQQMGLCDFDEPPLYPHFVSTLARRQTFVDFFWPKVLRPLEHSLAEFGFFYKKESTIVYCFNCGVGITDWLIPDDAETISMYPAIQHAIIYRNCVLVKALYRDITFLNVFLAYDVKNRTRHLQNFLEFSGASSYELNRHIIEYQECQQLLWQKDVQKELQKEKQQLLLQKDKKPTKTNTLFRFIEKVTYNSDKKSAACSCSGDQEKNAEVPDSKDGKLQQEEIETLNLKLAESEASHKVQEVKNDEMESQLLCGTCCTERREICFLPCGHLYICKKCYFSQSRNGLDRIMACYCCRRDVKGAVFIYTS